MTWQNTKFTKRFFSWWSGEHQIANRWRIGFVQSEYDMKNKFDCYLLSARLWILITFDQYPQLIGWRWQVGVVLRLMNDPIILRWRLILWIVIRLKNSSESSLARTLLIFMSEAFAIVVSGYAKGIVSLVYFRTEPTGNRLLATFVFAVAHRLEISGIMSGSSNIVSMKKIVQQLRFEANINRVKVVL